MLDPLVEVHDPSTPPPPKETDDALFARELPPRAAEIFASILGLDLTPAPGEPLIANDGHRRWSGCIAMSGDWRGAVTLSCLEPMARTITAAMFGTEPDTSTDAEIQDAIGEMANMFGGQVKSVLGDRSVLGLPVVIEGDNFETTVPHSHAVVKLHFHCESHPVDVVIVGADARTVGARRHGSHAVSEN